METNKLEKAMNEINDFIKVRMNILLGDLIVQSEEYEETKRRILQLPFIQQIINEQLTNIQPPLKQEKIHHVFLNPIVQVDKSFDTDIIGALQKIVDNYQHDETLNESLPVEQSFPVDTTLNNDTEEHIFLNIEEHISEESHDEPEESHQSSDDEEDDEDHDVEIIENPEPTTQTIIEIEDVETDYDEGDEVEDEVEESDKLVVEDDDEEGVFEIDINNVTYYTNDEKNGDIYEITEDGEPGNQIGRFIDGSPMFDKK